eukprot:5856682-Alexandrium_andersonii.AAC.1
MGPTRGCSAPRQRQSASLAACANPRRCTLVADMNEGDTPARIMKAMRRADEELNNEKDLEGLLR